ncbi:30S ribosome-binding factor RbfA [Tissierella sp.]|uniref:30S ribosome-binding factor RbfA n=1 Tax=Tissierella sp. TaxID=41274 RepID=UPI002865026C|nr:30S ribosome-binding factor RbfA [Tissierella sp.]MDR7856226.1 30S ribosome-binding factor RbfA [Tissierella sp.]
MNNKRLNRISEEVKRVVSELIYNGLKDPRVNSMTTVTNVEVTRDLRFANIYISVFGNKEDKDNTIIGLESAKGFIRKEIGSRIDLRYAPEPIFYLDESIEQGIYMTKLIENLNQNNSDQKEERND